MLLMEQNTLLTTSTLSEYEELESIIANLNVHVQGRYNIDVTEYLNEFVAYTSLESFIKEEPYLEISTDGVELDIDFNFKAGKITLSQIL